LGIVLLYAKQPSAPNLLHTIAASAAVSAPITITLLPTSTFSPFANLSKNSIPEYIPSTYLYSLALVYQSYKHLSPNILHQN